MRRRTKLCAGCEQPADALYRCRYGPRTEWVFLCSGCLAAVKAAHPQTYQYGGTWKRRKQ